MNKAVCALSCSGLVPAVDVSDSVLAVVEKPALIGAGLGDVFM